MTHPEAKPHEAASDEQPFHVDVKVDPVVMALVSKATSFFHELADLNLEAQGLGEEIGNLISESVSSSSSDEARRNAYVGTACWECDEVIRTPHLQTVLLEDAEKATVQAFCSKKCSTARDARLGWNDPGGDVTKFLRDELLPDSPSTPDGAT